jgi:O-antigen ligase
MSRAATLIHGLPSRGTSTIAVASVLTAALAGVALASDVPSGLAVLAAALYLPLVVLNLPLGVALWVPLVFLEALPTFNFAGKAAGLVLIVGWVGALRSGQVSAAILSQQRRHFEFLGLLVVWLSLSVLWARDPALAWGNLWYWVAVATVFLVVATASASEKALKLITTAFVVGALAAVAASEVVGSGTGGRLEVSAVGDPNVLAAGLVPAIALAAALLATTRGAFSRWLLVVAIGLMTASVIATQSRGNLVAAIAAGVTALVVLKRRRRQVIALALITVGVATTMFMLDSSAWDRVTADPGRGSGRVDIWTVAWHVAQDNPGMGVGLNNFNVVAPDYVRDSGPLQRVDLIADRPHFVHNIYLQYVAETGIVGLAFFVVFAGSCLYACWQAAGLFRAAGRQDLEALAHGIMIGTVATLGEGMFISNEVDRRLWILLALGPGALAAAHAVAARSRLAAG